MRFIFEYDNGVGWNPLVSQPEPAASYYEDVLMGLADSLTGFEHIGFTAMYLEYMEKRKVSGESAL